MVAGGSQPRADATAGRGLGSIRFRHVGEREALDLRTRVCERGSTLAVTAAGFKTDILMG
jgi:hypothetical protein